MGLKLFLTLTLLSGFISCSLSFVVNKVPARVNGSNWMSDNINDLGPKKLKEMCILGSHNAGMNVFNKPTIGAHKCNTLAQSFPIRDQLSYGARYLDVRPAIYNGEYYAGHYSTVLMTYHGAIGQPMKSIVNDINQFIEEHHEFVMVRLDNSVNKDRGRHFDHEDWDELFHLLAGTKNLYVTTDRNVNLHQKTLNELTDNGTKGAVVYLIDEESVDLGAHLGKGFLKFSNLRLQGANSKTDSIAKMKKNQIAMMKSQLKDKYFLLHWTLTQSPKAALTCSTGFTKSIIQLAKIANARLNDIVHEVTADAFPNILHVDNIVGHSFLDAVTEINKKINNK